MADKGPVDEGSKEATFTALAADFRLDDKARALFLKGSTKKLEDFRFYFVEESGIVAFVAMEKALEGAEQRIQTARGRRAWTAVGQNGLRR